MKIIKRIIFMSFVFFVMIVLGGAYNKVHADPDHLVNSNFNYTYTTTVDNPITLEHLIEVIDLNAYDASGNNITSHIVVSNPGVYIANVLNQPTPKEVILGNYRVTYKVYDKYGNYNSCNININVIDNVAPVIDENSNAVLEINKLEVNENTFELVKRGIIVSDNHDYDLIYEFEDGFDLLTAVGFHGVNLNISDSSGNTSSIYMEIYIYDTIGPKIYADTTYIKTSNVQEPIEFSDIIMMCNIYSIDLETNESCEIKINYDNYTENFDKSGVYMIRAYAEDEIGNRTNFYIYIEVVDIDDPVFYLSSTAVTISTNTMFNLEKADELIRARKLVRNENYTLSIEADEYTVNKEKPGEYKYQVKATYEDKSESLFEFIITVEEEQKEEPIEEPIEEPTEPENVTFFEKLKKAFKVIWKVVKWPFEKLGRYIKQMIKKDLVIKKSLLFKK